MMMEPCYGISALVRRDPRAPSPTQGSSTDTRGLDVDPTRQHLHVGRPASRSVRNTFLVFKPPGLWDCYAAHVG